ncbi:MAG TPA: TonB-dependent receptor [Thermoanaerobaculaceae bacterium]|nr:TonB-dependent receptor [Thermoanaerobaculaceae bacterium]
MVRIRPFLVAVLFPVAVCLAQQPPTVHDTVVVTATGEPVPADQVPAASTVITAEEMQALGAVSVADVLRLVPGATLLQSGRDNDTASLFVRGTSSTQTLVLFDGVRLNSPYFGGYDWSLPLALGLDRVEVVRGPYSALYGGDALGGVVQLVPSRAAGDGVRALVEGGSQQWRRTDVEASVVGDGVELLAAGGSRDGSGTLANDGFWSREGMVEVSAAPFEGGKLGLLLRRAASHTEVPFSGALATPHRFTAEGENLAALPFHAKLGSDGELELVASRVERALTYRDPDDPGGFVASDTEADSDELHAALHERWGAHAVTLGGEWRRDTVTDGSSFGPDLAGVRIATRAWFLQDQLALAPRWELLAGLRWDDAAAWGREWSPRLTLAWGDGVRRAWASYGRAFRAPSLGELYYPFSGNPSLRPERSRSFELGAAFPVPAARGALQVVGFSNRETDLIDFDLVAFRFANISRALQDGVEASWIAAVGTRGRVEAALTWLDARDGSGAPLLRRPTWSGALALIAPLGGGVEGSASLVWVGARTDADPLTFADVRQPGFATVNLAAKVPLASRFSARLRIENAADRSYEEVRGYPAPGRRVMVGLETVLR